MPIFGHKNHVTPHKRWIRILRIVLFTVPRKAWVQAGRMRSSAQAFSPAQSREWDRKHMRRQPNNSPGPPRSLQPMSA